MIKRLRVQGYKSLGDVDIQFKNPLTVMIGANTAGKSNLLDVLALLGRLATRDTLMDAFDEHRGTWFEAFSWDEDGLEGVMKRPVVKFEIAADVEVSESVVKTVEKRIEDLRRGLPEKRRARVIDRFMRYHLAIAADPQTGHLRVMDEMLYALNNAGNKKPRNAFIEKVGEKIHLRMEGQAHPTYHDLGLDYTLVSRPLYAPHYPHVAAFKEELSRWQCYYLEPTVMRQEQPIKEVESIGRNGSDIAPYYYTLKRKNPRQFDAVSKALNALIPSIDAIDVRGSDRGFVQLNVVEGGVPFSSRMISEGTLRILGLLAIATSNNPATTVGFEEPENGVHTRRLRLMADLLINNSTSEKQFIVTTHSYLLPNYIDVRSIIMCQKQGRRTVFFEPSMPLSAPHEIGRLLEEQPAISERVLSGEYGG